MLDFGLAKARFASSASSDSNATTADSIAPTITSEFTMPGKVMDTTWGSFHVGNPQKDCLKKVGRYSLRDPKQSLSEKTKDNISSKNSNDMPEVWHITSRSAVPVFAG